MHEIEQLFDVAASFNITFFRVSVSPFWTIIPSKDIGLLSHGAYCRFSFTVRAIPSLSKNVLFIKLTVLMSRLAERSLHGRSVPGEAF